MQAAERLQVLDVFTEIAVDIAQHLGNYSSYINTTINIQMSTLFHIVERRKCLLKRNRL